MTYQPGTYPDFYEEWWEVAGELEELAERIRTALEDESGLPTFAVLHPNKRETVIIRETFANYREPTR